MTDRLIILKDRWKEDKSILILLFSFCFLFLFFISKFSPLYPVNEWSDINVYFNVGKAIANGKVLYSEIFDHKGPLLFFIYAIGYILSPSSTQWGMFIIQLVFWFTFSISLFFTFRYYLSKFISFLSVLLVFVGCLGFMNTGGSAEEFVLIISNIGLCFFISYFHKNKLTHPPKFMLVHGLLFSAVLLIKLNLVVFWCFPLCFIFIALLLSREYKNFFLNILFFFLGLSIILLPMLFYFLCHGALDTAYYVYIELNKQYSSTNDYLYLLTNGISKLTRVTRENLLLMLIVYLGIIYAPFKLVKSKIFGLSLCLSGLALIGMIFFTLTYHFYYPLSLLIFLVLGLIIIFQFFEKHLTISDTKGVYQLSAAIILIFAIGMRNLYGMGGASILRLEEPNGPQFAFKQHLKKKENPSLLNTAFAEGNALFTTSNIVPSVKYFFCPNIFYGMYPDIRDSQTRYIENKEIDFVLSATNGFNYDYFNNLDILETNYQKIDSITSLGVTYFLYQKR